MPKSSVRPKAHQRKAQSRTRERWSHRLQAVRLPEPVWEYGTLAARMSPTTAITEERLKALEVLPIRMSRVGGPVRSLSMVQLADEQGITISEMQRDLISLHRAGLLEWDPVRLTPVQTSPTP